MEKQMTLNLLRITTRISFLLNGFISCCVLKYFNVLVHFSAIWSLFIDVCICDFMYRNKRMSNKTLEYNLFIPKTVKPNLIFQELPHDDLLSVFNILLCLLFMYLLHIDGCVYISELTLICQSYFEQIVSRKCMLTRYLLHHYHKIIELRQFSIPKTTRFSFGMNLLRALNLLIMYQLSKISACFSMSKHNTRKKIGGKVLKSYSFFSRHCFDSRQEFFDWKRRKILTQKMLLFQNHPT